MMIKGTKNKEQKKNYKYNSNKLVIYLTSAKHIAERLQKNKSFLQKKNPRWNCISNYINYMLLRDFGKQTLDQKRQELKDMIDVERNELNNFVASKNRTIMFFENELRILEDNNRIELGILNRPVHDEVDEQ